MAKAAFEAFGGKPTVNAYWDEAEKSNVDVLACSDSPQIGVSSYSSIGLSDSPLFSDEAGNGVGVELVGACSSEVVCFPNIVATAAFNAINSEFICFPGTIMPDVVDMYGCSDTMEHLLLVSPFLWTDKLRTQDFGNKQVAWLQLIPISESESRFANERGIDHLESRFELHQIDIFNINRTPVV